MPKKKSFSDQEVYNKKNNKVDNLVICPYCYCKLINVEKSFVRGTYFCWNCGKEFKYKNKVYDLNDKA